MGRKDQDKSEAEPDLPDREAKVGAGQTAEETAAEDAAEQDPSPKTEAASPAPEGETGEPAGNAAKQDGESAEEAEDDAEDVSAGEAEEADDDAIQEDSYMSDYVAAAHREEDDLHAAEHHDELDEHGSFPTWLKVALILVFGAALALWGGPRLAPLLPSGLEPVARFLTPGSVRQAQEIDARLSALEQRGVPELPQDAISAAVSAEVSEAMAEYDASVRARFEELGDTVTAVGSGDIKARLNQLENSVEGLEAQMASLGEQLSTAIAESIDRQTAVSAEQAATYQAMIDRLNAELDQLATRQGALQQSIDEVSAVNTRIREEAETIVTVTQAERALTSIAAALESGAPFRGALDTLAGATEADLPALHSFADSGAPSLAELKSEFAPLAYAALRAAMQAEAQGYTDRALAFFKAQVATRSLTPQPGDSTDAVLSRMDAALDAGNLAACLAEAEALSEAARAPLSGWLSSVSRLSAARAELDTAKAQIARQKS